MRNLFTLLFLAIFLSANAQDQSCLEQKNVDQIQLSTQINQSTFDLQSIQNWLATSSGQLQISDFNSKEHKAVLKGSSLIYTSKKKSAYQIKMFYSLLVKSENKQISIRIKDIYYESIPTYGKQGEPAVVYYPSDWFSKKKLYRKSGKERPLNVNVRNNTIAEMRSVLNDALAHLN